MPWIQVSRGHRHILGRGHSLMRFSSVMGMIMQSLCLTRASLSLSQETAKSWKGKDRKACRTESSVYIVLCDFVATPV